MSLHVGTMVRQMQRLGVGLLLALTLAACSSASLPSLSEPGDGGTQPKGVTAVPSVPPASAPPEEPATDRKGGGASKLSRTRSPSEPIQSVNAGSVIVGFKGPTVVLFGGEFGNEGERVSASSLSLPLELKEPSSNANRVQIDTAYGPRWIARSEIVLDALGRGMHRQR